MNEPISETSPVEIAPPSLPHKDRSAGLVVFGILTILLGCLAGLLVLLMLAGMTAARNPNPPPLATLLLGGSIYGILAVALIWLGIGSIMARRWARALLLIFSWTWLVMGLLAILAMAFILPKVFANLPHAGAKGQPPMAAVLAGMFMVFGFLFVLLPAIWTFFYQSRHVKATCATRDPVTRWTDACPLPVLGGCLWLAFTAAVMLFMPLACHGVVPFFGIFLSGVTGSILCLALAGLWGYAAWLLYQCDSRGWWLILIALVLFMLSSFLTYARHDLLEMYRLMGYPAAQIQQLQQTGLLTGNWMQWAMVFSVLPWLVYLLWIKQFVRGKAPAAG